MQTNTDNKYGRNHPSQQGWSNTDSTHGFCSGHNGFLETNHSNNKNNDGRSHPSGEGWSKTGSIQGYVIEKVGWTHNKNNNTNNNFHSSGIPSDSKKQATNPDGKPSANNWKPVAKCWFLPNGAT